MLDKYLERKLGFIKIDENRYAAVYKRHNEEYNYDQIVCIHHNDGRNIIESYNKDLVITDYIGNIAVGLEVREMIPFWLKAKWMNHKYHWNKGDKKK